MNAKEFSEEILAIWDESLPETKRKELLAALREDGALRDHLASHVAFKTMMKMSASEPHFEEEGGAHVDDETLGAFLEKALVPKEAETVQSHLKSCSDCFLRMAALSKALKERDSLAMPKTPASFIEKAKALLPSQEEVANDVVSIPVVQPVGIRQAIENLVEKVKQWLEPVPAWGYGLATVAAAVVLFLLLLPKSPVENFSLDNQLIIFEVGPMGFMGERETSEYKGMSVALSNDGQNLVFTWSEIPDAMFYEITLLEDGQKRKITPLGGVTQNAYSLPKQEVKSGMKYVWELSGKLKNEKGFEAKAEFVCRR